MPHFQTYPYFPTTSNNWWFAFLIIIFPIENPKKISMSRLSTGITMSVSTQPQEWANLVEPIHYRSTTPMGEITVPTTETVCRLARWARWQQLGCVIAWRGKMWLYFKIFKGEHEVLKMLDFKAWNLSGVPYLDGWTDGKAVHGTTWFHRLKRTQWVQIFQIFDSHHYISSLWELYSWISWDDSGASANSVTLRCIWRLGPHRI